MAQGSDTTNYTKVDALEGYYVNGVQIIDEDGNVDAPITTTNLAFSGTEIQSGITATTGAGAVAITGRVHEVTTTGTGDALTLADGTAAPIEAMPFVAYFKRSGFRPVSDFIQKTLTAKKKLMHNVVIELGTEKQKNGGVVYWTPTLALVKEVQFSKDDEALYEQFKDTVKGHNETVFNEYKSAQKATASTDDIDLSARLAG